ncbi:ABC transporter ATP-binding protein [Dactylosporangium sp. CA-092794]|uniref:ABC transporter ATP-binding protein n=1 Tax=Dactylosporangium sp. CA-092794 TaxID=3239929 RepID=UPI003D92BCD1
MPGAAPPDLLRLQRLSVAFAHGPHRVRPVRDVSFAIAPGGTRVILGESGSGKSVTIRTILGLHEHAHGAGGAEVSGERVFDGRDLGALSAAQWREVRGRGLGFVPQNPRHAFDPTRRIGAQLGEALREHGIARGRPAATARAAELLGQAGIPDPAGALRAYPHELSGGLCQRAAIAMAVACGPKLLLADEPTTALDMTVQAQILDLFRTLQRRSGMSLLLVTHDVGVAMDLGGEVSVMYAGRIVEEGPAAQVLGDPRHPYVRALLRAQPTPDSVRGGLAAIAGLPPAPTDPEPPGCAYAPRCDRAVAGCREHRPPLLPAGPGRAVACPVPPRPVPASAEVDVPHDREVV